MNNDFISFINSYYYGFLMEYDLKNKYVIVDKPSRFKIKDYKHYTIDSNLLFKYNRCINSIHELDINIIKEYIIFMRYMEKCFMNKNDISRGIYGEITEESNCKIYRLYLEWTKYFSKICIEFRSSNIKNPVSNNFIDKIIDDESENNIEFITVTISRDFGKNMKNTFKFVSGSSPTFNDESDEILYDNIINYASDSIIEDFHCMINHIAKFLDIGYDCAILDCRCGKRIIKKYDIFERLKKDGLWIQQCTNQ